MATRLNEPEYQVLTVAVTLVTDHPEHRQLADKITEEDCTVAGIQATTSVLSAASGRIRKAEASYQMPHLAETSVPKLKGPC